MTMGLLEDILLLPLKTKTALRGEADVVVALVVVVLVVVVIVVVVLVVVVLVVGRVGCYEFSSLF